MMNATLMAGLAMLAVQPSASPASGNEPIRLEIAVRALKNTSDAVLAQVQADPSTSGEMRGAIRKEMALRVEARSRPDYGLDRSRPGLSGR